MQYALFIIHIQIDDDNIDVQAPVQTKPLSEFSVDDVIHLLESLNLRNYCAVFQENAIDGPTLMYCNSVKDVEELGINIVAKARILYEAIVQFKSMINDDDEIATVFSEITYETKQDSESKQDSQTKQDGETNQDDDETEIDQTASVVLDTCAAIDKAVKYCFLVRSTCSQMCFRKQYCIHGSTIII